MQPPIPFYSNNLYLEVEADRLSDPPGGCGTERSICTLADSEFLIPELSAPRKDSVLLKEKCLALPLLCSGEVNRVEQREVECAIRFQLA